MTQSEEIQIQAGVNFQGILQQNVSKIYEIYSRTSYYSNFIVIIVIGRIKKSQIDKYHIEFLKKLE